MMLLTNEVTPVLRSKFLHISTYAPLFEALPETTLQRGEVLFQGPSNYVYFIKKGIIKLSSWYDGDEVLEDFFQAGELVNCEIIMAPPSKKHAGKALSNGTIVTKMPAYLFQQVINSNDVLQQEIFSKILASHKRTQEQLYRVSVLHSEHRVIHFLISYVARSGRQVGLEYVIKPILTHQGIGQIAGTSRQTVTTVLNKLRNDRIIHFNRTYLIIRDLDALKARLAERNRYV